MKQFLILIACFALSFRLSAQIVVNEELITLSTASGDIYGTLKIPISKKPIPVALIVAGSGPTDRNGNQAAMINNSLKMLSDGLFYNNIATLCFDKRGIGESKDALKSESDVTFDNYIEDVSLWVDLLAKDKRFSKITVVGHSEGSLIGMIVTANNTKVAKYVSVAGSGKPMDEILKEQLDDRLKAMPTLRDQAFSFIDRLKEGETIQDVPASLNVLFRPSVQPFLKSVFKYDPQTIIKKITTPLLIAQGTTDIQVPTAHAELLATANPKAEKLIIENMNHILKDCESMDMQIQIAIYQNAVKPINRDLVKGISDFIKK